MKSTGEGMGAGKSAEEALIKALSITGLGISGIGDMVISVNDSDKPKLAALVPFLSESRGIIYATSGTRKELEKLGIDSVLLHRIGDLREPRIDQIMSTEKLSVIVNTPSEVVDQIKDSFEIRRIAISRGIPLITNIRLAGFVFESLHRKVVTDYRELREYY
jgi:carbamoyl-phosphate synthase large subunit